MIWYPDYVDDGSMVGWSYEFEEGDKEYIREYIEETMPWWRSEHPSTTAEVPFCGPYEDVEIYVEVTLGDWFDDYEFNSAS